MKPSKALVIYKKTAYEMYVLTRDTALFRPGKGPHDRSYIKRFRRSHDVHAATLAAVKRVLSDREVPFRAVYRTKPVDASRYDLVICVGGDGTFLDAARRVKKQLMIGVNSDPRHSMGHFCSTDRKGFRRAFERLLAGRLPETRLNRLSLSLNGRTVPGAVLNEVLVCHANPAAMSRYWVQVGATREEQRSSGVWVSTAAGSSGAIRSAGGRRLDLCSAQRQYRPRELYFGRARYRLKGGVLRPGATLRIGSLMREGMIFIDGPHTKLPFRYGDVLTVSNSRDPLRVLGKVRRAP